MINPSLKREYLDFIEEVKAEFLTVEDGYDEADYFFLEITILLDRTYTRSYAPLVLLSFGKTYIDDEYLQVVVSPTKKYKILGAL